MNMQTLMDLPGYGQANKRVKAMGMWRETMTDTERIEWLAENAETITRLDHNQSWKITEKRDDYYPYFFRMDIDEAVDKQVMALHRAYLED